MNELNVGSQIHFDGEALGADVALEGALGPVPRQVLVQSGAGVEVLPAHLTLVLPIIWSSKNNGGAYKDLYPTFFKRTFFVYFTSMIVQVFFEVEFVDKTLSTLLQEEEESMIVK